MTERKTYLFFLFNEEGAPIYIDDGGNVQVGDPTTLKRPDGRLADLDQAPEGWQGILVKYARNMQWMGLFRNMSVPLQFPGDGANILMDGMWNHGGVECVRFLGIMLLDKLSTPYQYDSWYLCELDFKKYNQQKDKVLIQALEGGLSKYLNANDSIKYPIELDNPKSFYLLRDGIVLTERANYEMAAGIEIDYNTFGSRVWMPLNFFNKEGSASGVAFFTQNLEPTSLPTFPITTQNFIAKAGSRLNPDPVQVEITGNIYYKVINDGDGSTSFRMRFQTTAQDLGNQDDYNLGIPGTWNTDDIITTPVNITIPLRPADQLYLTGFFFGAGPFDNAKIQILPDSKLVFKYSNRMYSTYSKEMYAIDLLKAVVDKMSDGKYTAESSFLSTKKDLSFTCGDSIRFNGIQAGHKIETSLKDLFQALKVSSGESLGAAIRNNILVVEPLSYFFKDEIVLDLGEIGDFPEVTVLEDLIYDEIRAGYEKNEYENVNGRIEFNQGQDWKLPILKVKNKLDLESTFRADPIGTELYRIEVVGLDTTDKTEDKKPFVSKIETVSQNIVQTVDFVSAGNYMTNPFAYPFNPGSFVRIIGGLNDGKILEIAATGINIVQFYPSTPVIDEIGIATTIVYVTSGLFHFSRPVYTAVEGIPPEMVDSIYNTEITPKQAILNNGDVISGGCDQLETKLVEFIKADMNDALATTIAGVTLRQKENIQIGSLKQKLWKPYAIKINAKSQINVLALIEENPFGKIKFTVNGFDHFCFLMDGGVEPETMAIQEWVLLASGTTDMRRFKIRE